MFKTKLLLLAIVPLVVSILVTSIVTAYNEQALIEKTSPRFGISWSTSAKTN
jgi:hypothetical protein